MFETDIIRRTEETTDEPNSNDDIYAFMVTGWNACHVDDEAIYRSGFSEKNMNVYIAWFCSLDERFHLDLGTVFQCYKWATFNRFKQGLHFMPITSVSFNPCDIVHDHRKIHTNCAVIAFKDGTSIPVPIKDDIDYSLQ